jgi:uncharacterized protein YndB with AHSA1/START domain
MNAIVLASCIALAVAQTAGTPPDSIVSQAIVGAPAERVWEAFTTKAGMESWMAANGDIEPRVGGRMRTSHRKDADLDGDTSIHHTILRLEPARLLSYRTIKSPAGFPFASSIGQTWTEIQLEPVDADRTRVTVTMRGYTADPEMQKMRAFFEWGNRATLDALVKKFAAVP